MNKTPSILVNTGFEVDQNGALTEIVIPKVVNTLNVPRKVTFEGQVLNWVPSTAAALQEFEAPNMTALGYITSGYPFRNFTALQKIKFDRCTSIAYNRSDDNTGLCAGCTALHEVIMPELLSTSAKNRSASRGGIFYNCTSITSVSLPKLTTIDDSGGGLFCYCTGLQSVSLPSLTSISNSGGGTFDSCTALVNIELPKLQSTNMTDNWGGTFYGCTSLQNVTLGSEGNPVSSLHSRTFNGCTQSGLTITIYTTGGAALSGSPWGATNATIVYEEA